MCALRKEIAKKHLHNKYSVITREARRAVSQNPEYATLREHGHTFDKPWVRSLKREFGPKIDLDTMTGKCALKLLKRSKMFGITRVKSKDIKKHIFWKNTRVGIFMSSPISYIIFWDRNITIAADTLDSHLIKFRTKYNIELLLNESKPLDSTWNIRDVTFKISGQTTLSWGAWKQTFKEVFLHYVSYLIYNL